MRCVPFFASVMIFSAMRFSSFAFGVVVTIRSCLMSEITMLRNMAVRCSVVRSSRRPATRCFISFS